MSEYDLVVLGSGPAGQRAAIAAAKLGKHVALVERDADVGGACLHQGTIPSKTLREVVAYLSGIRQREVYGAAHRVKEQVTVGDLTFRTQRVTENEVNIVRDHFIRNRVDVVPGRASFLDPHRVLAVTQDGQRVLQTQKTVIAVGTVPARPEGIEFDDRRVIDSDGLLRLQEIPRSMTFVGAGVVGLEYATIFQVLGVQVTLVDGRWRPLDFVDDEIQDALYYHMRDEGITLRFGERVSRVRLTGGSRVLVELESGKTFTTDSLMFSVGRQGASGALNLEAIGVHPDARGRLKVDEHFRTECENVYAAGDIIGFPSLASASMEQGRLAALHAFGMPAPPLPPNLPYGMYTIPEIAMIGPTERRLTEQSVPYEVGVAPFRELSRVQISGGRSGILKLLFHRHTMKLLAVHILGQNATELVHIGQTLIDHGGTIEYLRDAVFNYPTLAEAYKAAALNGLNRL